MSSGKPENKSVEEGVVQKKLQTSGESRPAEKFDVSKLSSLSDILPDFGLYTPALLYLTVPLDNDPFDQFVVEQGLDVQQLSLRFDKPLFSGLAHHLADAAWNYTLFAVPKEYWDRWIAWVGTCVYKSPGQQHIARVRWQDIKVADAIKPLAPSVPVKAMVMETTLGATYFSTDPVPSPIVDRNVVFEDTAAFAKAIAQGDPDPYKAANEAAERSREG